MNSPAHVFDRYEGLNSQQQNTRFCFIHQSQKRLSSTQDTSYQPKGRLVEQSCISQISGGDQNSRGLKTQIQVSVPQGYFSQIQNHETNMCLSNPSFQGQFQGEQSGTGMEQLKPSNRWAKRRNNHLKFNFSFKSKAAVDDLNQQLLLQTRSETQVLKDILGERFGMSTQTLITPKQNLPSISKNNQILSLVNDSHKIINSTTKIGILKTVFRSPIQQKKHILRFANQSQKFPIKTKPVVKDSQSQSSEQKNGVVKDQASRKQEIKKKESEEQQYVQIDMGKAKRVVGEMDDVTGLNLENYLIKGKTDDIFFEKIKKSNVDSIATSPIKKNTLKVCKEFKITDIDGFEKGFAGYCERRTLIDLQNQLKHPSEHGPENCSVLNISMDFLRKILNKKSPTKEKQLSKVCNHQESDEDRKLRYLDEYTKIYKFFKDLSTSRQQAIQIETLVKAIVGDQGDRREEQEEKVRALLQNPLVQLVIAEGEGGDDERKLDYEDLVQNIFRESDFVNQKLNMLVDQKGYLTLKKSTSIVIEDISKMFTSEPPKTTVAQQRKVLGFELFGKSEDEFTTNDEIWEQNKEIVKSSLKTIVDQYCTEFTRFSCQRIWDNIPQIQLHKMKEEEINEHKHSLILIDETISDRAQKIIDKISEILRTRALKFTKTQTRRETMESESNISKREISDEDEQSMAGSMISEGSSPKQLMKQMSGKKSRRDHVKLTGTLSQNLQRSRHELFKNLHQQQQFYKQAKKLIQGYNKPENKDTLFFDECRTKKVLPLPFFTCIQGHELRQQGCKFGLEYAQALRNQIANNNDPSTQIYRVLLDDCKMTDQELVEVLEGIKGQKQGCLQSLQYSNNELGENGADQICQFLELSHTQNQRVLEHLTLSNLLIKSKRVTEKLMDGLADSGMKLVTLQIQQINLNSQTAISKFCIFMEQNGKLSHLKLSECHLQAKQLALISESLMQQAFLISLDLSGNSVCDQNAQNSSQMDSMIVNIGNFIQNNSKITAVNLEGMFLGGQRVIKLAEFIRDNKSLMQVNLTNNLLTLNDQNAFYKTIDCNLTHPQKLIKSLESMDLNIHQNIKYFKESHSSQSWKGGQDNPSEIIPKIINSDIFNIARQRNGITNKLRANYKVGEVLSSLSINLMADGEEGQTRDKLVVERFSGFYEMTLNELGESIFLLPEPIKVNQWHRVDFACQSDQVQNITHRAYVLTYFDRRQADIDFELITDLDQIASLKLISLADEYLRQVEDNKIDRAPLLFGSATNWKVMQMQQVLNFTALLVAENDEERRNVILKLQNPKNQYIYNFPFLSSVSMSLIESIVGLHQAQVVGRQNFYNLQMPTNLNNRDTKMLFKEFSNNYLFPALLSTGKHSIFIFDPQTASFYKKIIVVDQISSFVPRFSLFNQDLSKISANDLVPNNAIIFPKLREILPQHLLLEFIDTIKRIQLDDFANEDSKTLLKLTIEMVLQNYLKIRSCFESLIKNNSKKLVEFSQLKKLSQEKQLIDKNDQIPLKRFKQGVDLPGFVSFIVWCCLVNDKHTIVNFDDFCDLLKEESEQNEDDEGLTK